ncbi:hypothetical protein OAS86_02165 [Gammaproteobacteria bacterium]|nr:hypothetical protein [Gammaproteobacteria bacterium]
MNVHTLATLVVFSQRWKPYVFRVKDNPRPNLRSIGFFSALLNEQQVDIEVQKKFYSKAEFAVEASQNAIEEGTRAVKAIFHEHNSGTTNVVPYIEPGETTAQFFKEFLPPTHRCAIGATDIIWNVPLIWKLARLIGDSQHLYGVTFYGKRMFFNGNRVYRDVEPYTRVLSQDQFRYYNALAFRECARALGIVGDLAHNIDPTHTDFVPRSPQKTIVDKAV